MLERKSTLTLAETFEKWKVKLFNESLEMNPWESNPGRTTTTTIHFVKNK